MQISQTCYAVTGLGAPPPWVVNAGFIVGGRKTLIVDTGMNLLAAQTIHGYATCIRPQNELLVVNTEPHFDHIGGNGFFQLRGVMTYGHAAIHRTEQEFAIQKDEINQSVTNPIRRMQDEAAVFFTGTHLANPMQAIEPGERLDLGKLEVEIIGTPGHTPFNLSVYNREDRVLFCGDCIVTGYLPNLEAGFIDDWKTWLQSLHIIEALEPQSILPGHGNIISGPAAVSSEIDRMRKVIEKAIEQKKAPTV
jgi:glyoxylase-like metal-dependent hydrolase (beta-lactamase superfamily II)